MCTPTGGKCAYSTSNNRENTQVRVQKANTKSNSFAQKIQLRVYKERHKEKECTTQFSPPDPLQGES